MAEILGYPIVSLTVAFKVTEAEARALDALAGYGDDAFIGAFYDKLGKAYMQEHEQGLRLFLKSIRSFMPSLLTRTAEARKTFNPCVPANNPA